MTQLMQSHTEQVRIRADVPALRIVQMHIARNRLRIRIHRIERMRQDPSRSIKGIRIAMSISGPQNIHRLRRGRARSSRPCDLRHARPLRHRPRDLRLRRRRVQLRGHVAVVIEYRRRSQPRPVPSIAVSRNRLRCRAIARQRADAWSHRQSPRQLVRRRKNIRHRIQLRQTPHQRHVTRLNHQVMRPKIRILTQHPARIQNYSPSLVQIYVGIKFHQQIPTGIRLV